MLCEIQHSTGCSRPSFTIYFSPHQVNPQYWDLGSGKLIETLKYKSAENDPEYLYCCKFVDADRVVAGGSGNNDAKVIV